MKPTNHQIEIGKEERSIKKKRLLEKQRAEEKAESRKATLELGDVEAPAPVGKKGEKEFRLRGDYKIVPIDQIRPNKWNYNEQSDFIFEKLGISIKKFGFVEPLIVRSANQDGPLGYYEILGGEHRYKRARQDGATELPVIDVGKMKDISAKKLLINLIDTKGRPNPDQLSILIAGLKAEGVDLTDLPFDQTEIDSFLEAQNFDWKDVVTDPDAGGQDEKQDGPTGPGILDALGYDKLPEDQDLRLGKRLMKFRDLLNTTSTRPWRLLDQLMDHWENSHAQKT